VTFPANEVDIFHNREMRGWGNIFGQDNIDPALWSCEVRVVVVGQTIDDNKDFLPFETQLCQANVTDRAKSCPRPFPPGGHPVVFPQAKMWLSAAWTDQQNYYHARSCSSDQSTCIAELEGTIESACA